MEIQRIVVFLLNSLSLNSVFQLYTCVVDGAWKCKNGEAGVAWVCFNENQDIVYQQADCLSMKIKTLQNPFLRSKTCFGNFEFL